MTEETLRSDRLRMAAALDQAWIQYRANFARLIPFGMLAVLPPLGFLHSVPLGLALLFGAEGTLVMMLVDAIHRADTEERPDLLRRCAHRAWHNIKNGTIILLFVLPLLLVGFAALIVPSILFFSFFLFSFHHAAVRDKFAIDACMESYRNGRGLRGPLFLVALSFYLVLGVLFLVAYQLSGGAGWLAVLPCAFFLPYYFLVIEELFQRLEQS
ncbi:MAG TPA: hypothetical protein P5077_04290 [bacterium]|nr:hypothetical protein [bacterium]